MKFKLTEAGKEVYGDCELILDAYTERHFQPVVYLEYRKQSGGHTSCHIIVRNPTEIKALIELGLLEIEK